MKKLFYNASVFVLAIALTSCGGESKKENKNADKDKEKKETADKKATKEMDQASFSAEKEGIKVYEADIAKEFMDAKLMMDSPEKGSELEAGEQTFSFGVKNYTLKEQTPGAKERHCANSNKGQHIHFILNNAPYQAHYDPEFKAEVSEGNNVVLAFLSRSYHESIKTEDAHLLVNFPVGNVEEEFDKNGEHLFYSRPKGTYSGKFTEKILLDFYLINTDLSKDGNKVRATINGTEFVLPSWKPYFIEGLPMGENTVKIELIDKDGNPVPGPFNNSGERTITLEKEEAA